MILFSGNNMTRSDFSYKIVDDIFICIVDEYAGRMSVTNDIENVIKYISTTLNKSIDNYKVIYKDTEGIIDGINTLNGEFKTFYHIGASTFNEAIEKIK